MDYGALHSRDLRLLSKHASKLVCLVLILLQITLLRGHIHPNEQLRCSCSINGLSFCCILMILHLSRMRKNINRKVYNAGKM